MTLFSSIQVGKNALFAAQIGLHVAGNNIANANTPGYVRQDVVLVPAPTQEIGGLLLGLGVEVSGIVQRSDKFLDESVRTALSDLTNGELQEQTYLQLEALLGELSDTDLSTSLTEFFNSIHDVLNQPESVSVRNIAALQGKALTDRMNQLSTRLFRIRGDVNDQVDDAALEINGLVEEIAKLNIKITEKESGETSTSVAGNLRQQRSQHLESLAKILNIRTVEQKSGGVAVFVGGDFLVFEGVSRQVETVFEDQDGLSLASVQIKESKTPINPSSGKLAGLFTSRDEIVGHFSNQLDDFASTLIHEFNKVHSSGQGLIGLQDVTSEFAVDDSSAPLDSAGLEFVPENGSFQVKVRNQLTGLTKTTDIFVRLNGMTDDTSMDDLVADLSAINGITAQLTSQQQLVIQSDSAHVDFSFANDTSGILASLGVNTFFRGSSAFDIGVADPIVDDPARFAASQGGVGQDSENAVAMSQFFDAPLESQEDASLSDRYSLLTNEVTQSTSVARSVADGFRVFHGTLQSEQLALSGVSLDEEAIRMIAFQRSFQAAARFVQSVSEMLDILVNL